MQHMGPLWAAILLIVLLTIVGCHARRPGFMGRVRGDCVAGQQWACDLLDAFSRPPSTDDTTMPDSIRGDRPAERPRP
jgi:hypothetical protein